MGSLERFAKQIRELVSTMTLASRIMAVLMAGVIIVSLGWIASNQQSGQTEYVLGGQTFSEEQLDKMERALSQAGLRKYDRVGNRLKVPTLERDQYVKAMAEGNAMPENWDTDMLVALDAGKNPFVSPGIMRERVRFAKQQSLAKILRAMPGIEQAGVYYDEKEARFGRNADQSASIYMRGFGNQPISNALLRQVSEVATTHFPGLKAEKVSVLDVGTGNLYRGNSDPMSIDQQPLLRAQREWEERYEDKFRKVLSVYGDVKIGVIVELDPTIKRETEQLKYDPAPTALQQANTSKTMKSAKAAPGGRPGAQPNAGLSNQAQSIATQADQTSDTKETQENLKSVAGHQATLTKEAGLTVKRVSVTVGVPDSLYREINQQRFAADPNNKDKTAPPLTPEDLAKLQKETEDNIRAALEGQLPQVRQGDDRFQLVKVYSFTAMPVAELPKPTMAENSLAWFKQNWSTLGLFILVGMSLLMMFSWVRAQASPPSDREFATGFGLEVPESMGDSLDLGDESAPQENQEQEDAKFQVTGGEIKEELSSLIKQNPDAAVNLLRSWIGEAA